jgi:hypothetical protein
MPADISTLISRESITALQQEVRAAELEGTLTGRQRDIIYQAGWFRMFLPSSLGGLELGLPEGLRLEEALARIDGSLGWTVTLCSGATMFAGFLEAPLAKELLADPHACFGGSGAPGGIADRQAGGYRITGMWKYATGTPHLTAFTANCVLRENGIPLKDESGQPQVRAFVFKADEVIVHEDWNTMGLRATAGHSFEVNDLHVPAERAFDIMPGAARHSAPIFQYPFLPFAETTLAVNTSGMALHFLECCEAILTEKAARDNGKWKEFYAQLISEGKEQLSRQRAEFYVVADNSWAELLATGACSPVTLKAVDHVSRRLVWEAREVVQRLFPYCGMAATRPESTINRIWRDLFTASQHSLLNGPTETPAG